MDLRHLRYLVAVADRGNVSRAAAALKVSQPALSRQIHDLEAELKVALFERAGRSLRLTGAGEDLLAYARRALDSAAAFRERATAIGGGETGVLRAGATPQSLQRLFAPLIQRFRHLMPNVEVRLTEGDSRALIEGLKRGDLHIAFTSYQPEFGVSSLPGGTVQMFAVAGEGFRGRKSTIEIDELEDEPLLVLQRGYGSRDLFDAVCRLAHVRVNIFLESNAPATLLALAKAGCGLAILPNTVLLPQHGYSIRKLVREGRPLAVATAVHWNPRHLLPSYANRFAQELARHARGEFSASGRRRRECPRARSCGRVAWL